MADTSLMVIPPTMTGVILFAPGKADEVIAEIKAEAAERAERDRLEAVAKKAVEEARPRILAEVLADMEVIKPQPIPDGNYAHVVERTGHQMYVENYDPNRTEEQIQEPFIRPDITAHDIDEEQSRHIRFEAWEAIRETLGGDGELADKVIEAIAKGLVSHVSIQY